MVLTLDPDCLKALEDHHQPGRQVAAFYGGSQTVADVPVTADGSLDFDASAQIQSAGSIYLAGDGESLVPHHADDPLAPFGQEVTVDHTVTVGETTWRIPLGRFRIQEVPSAREYFARYPSARALVGWVAQVKVADHFEMIDADDFLEPTGPEDTTSTYSELARLSPIPFIQNPGLDDTSIPSGISYTSRLSAITALAKNLGGVPAMTRQGALTVRRANTWLTAGEDDAVFTVDGVIDVDDGMSNDIKNQVVVTCPSDESIVAVAKLTDDSNPLSVGRMGGRTYKLSDPLMDTQTKADKAAQTALKRVSSQQAKTVKITCLPRPDLELGDFGKAIDTATGRTFLGEVSTMRFSMNPRDSMSLELQVAEEL